MKININTTELTLKPSINYCQILLWLRRAVAGNYFIQWKKKKNCSILVETYF